MNSLDEPGAPRSILSIRNLHLHIATHDSPRPLLQGLSLDLPRGQTTALLGETGSGKSLAAWTILRILPSVAHITAGQILFNDRDLLTLDDKEMASIRGNRISMIFQEPETSLNPLMTIGEQICEPLRIHQQLSHANARRQVFDLMDLVGMPDPERRFDMYPYQLSAGARQRVVIAMALSCRPDILLADAPTSALDATVQSQILDLLARLIKDLKMSVLLISHDLGVVGALADRVAVLHNGCIVEENATRALLHHPDHPYTQSLVSAWRSCYE